MSSGFSGPSVPCRVCGENYPANSPTCPRCGYTPQLSTPEVGPRRPKIPLAARRRFSGAATVVVLVGLLLPLAAGLLLFRSVSDDAAGRVTVEEPNRGPVAAGRCRTIMTRYLEQLLAAIDDPEELNRLLIDASNEFGPGTRRFQSFADIMGDPALASLAARGKVAKALRRARPAIAEGCRK